jgi:hypothetical protein
MIDSPKGTNQTKLNSRLFEASRASALKRHVRVQEIEEKAREARPRKGQNARASPSGSR